MIDGRVRRVADIAAPASGEFDPPEKVAAAGSEKNNKGESR
jgi:hypothetical protein